MYPRLSGEGRTVPNAPHSYGVFKNSNFVTENTHVMDLIRKQQRSKISPLLPNPVYLPAFYQNFCHNGYVNQRDIPQHLQQPVKKIIVPQYFKKKQQVSVSCPQLLENNTSTSTPNRAICYVDSNATKTNLLQRITNVDAKIAEIELELVERKKLEAAKKKLSVKQVKQPSQPGNYNLFKKIIKENQQKAHQAHSFTLNLGPPLDFPLYYQPCDTPSYHENKKHFLSFKDKLKMFLRKKCVARVKTQKSLLRLYSHLACKWKSNIDKIENSRRYKSKEVKNKNYFETVFPELHKKKLTRERSKRTSDRVLSEADYQEVLHKFEYENVEYSLLKSSSVLPPVLLDSEQMGKFFLNQNNLIREIKGTGEKEFFNLWTPKEKTIFKEKFIQFSKDFGKIASFLEKKSVGDCVKYYYLTKKRENYKISGKSKKMQHAILQQCCVASEKDQELSKSNTSVKK